MDRVERCHGANEGGMPLVRIVRGTMPMFRVLSDSSGPRLVHSTDLRGARVFVDGRRGTIHCPVARAPAVMLPRVGRISEEKVAVYAGPDPLALSDCVLALECSSTQAAEMVRETLTDNFVALRNLYVGTGAPFITLARLKSLLAELGIRESP